MPTTEHERTSPNEGAARVADALPEAPEEREAFDQSMSVNNVKG